MNEITHIRDVLAGNSDAFRPLVERYQTGLIIHCENLLKDRALGEDIAQESFIKAYQSLASFNADKAKFSTWLYKIATNKCIDELRKQRKKLPLQNADEISIESTSELYDDEVELLRKAVDVLEPPEYSKAIKAYYWEGKSYEQIADELGTNSKTIGVWLHRAKSQLKEALV